MDCRASYKYCMAMKTSEETPFLEGTPPARYRDSPHPRKRNGFKGRGVSHNPKNRFEETEREKDMEEDSPPRPSTEWIPDLSRTVITYNRSPDIPFTASLNPYRGCEHGCAYCYARPTHEYLGYSSGLDFETKILVKTKAPELLERELASPTWKPQTLVMSGVTDPYQPVEKRLRLTRRCLEILVHFRNPVAIITKNHMVTRDRDLLADLAAQQAAMVFLSLHSLDSKLVNKLEPRASAPGKRLQAVKALRDAGIPCSILIAPVIPGLNDREIPRVVEAAKEVGASSVHYVLLRLPYANKTIFDRWLSDHYPLRRKKILKRLSQLRGGKLNDPRFFERMRGRGPYADLIRQQFQISCRRFSMSLVSPSLSASRFQRQSHGQMRFF